MDSVDGIKLFNDNGEITLPNISQADADKSASLISDDINDIITQETVKTLILPESQVIDEKNYVFDFSESESISVFKKEALKGLVSFDRKDVTLYLYKKNKLVEFGKGDSYELDRIIPLMVEHILDEGTKVYKDYKRGEKPKIVEQVDITKLRLNL